MSESLSMAAGNKADIIIVGAGLAGLMTAWRCLDVNPDLRVMVVERADVIGGDHTWSFNVTDIATELRDWIAPFIAYRWDRYDVKFPARERTLDIEYCTGNSDTLRACVAPHIKSGRLSVMTGVEVDKLETDNVTLSSGEVMTAACVLDARGFAPNDDVYLGYQKFVGHVIKTPTPHGLSRPIIMDATVEQLGGYRFVYCLPYSDTEILVEDTYYTDGPELRSQEVDARIKDYIRDNLGVVDYEVVRREKGILPITLAKTDSNHAQSIGIRGGYYHAVTGYSLPNAVVVANEIAQDARRFKHYDDKEYCAIKATTLNSMLQTLHWKNETFFRLLNRMLFRAAKPEARYKVLERFYGLNEGLIARFYAGDLTWRDKLRILAGKPPVPVTKALYNFSEKAFIKREKAARDNRNKK